MAISLLGCGCAHLSWLHVQSYNRGPALLLSDQILSCVRGEGTTRPQKESPKKQVQISALFGCEVFAL